MLALALTATVPTGDHEARVLQGSASSSSRNNHASSSNSSSSSSEDYTASVTRRATEQLKASLARSSTVRTDVDNDIIIDGTHQVANNSETAGSCANATDMVSGTREERCSGSDFLIFSRIPKTGGTMLRSFIDEHIDVADELVIEREEERMAESLSSWSRLLFTPHSAFGMHEVGCHKCCYFTVMRHPLDRAISNYYHDGAHADSTLGELENSLLSLHGMDANPQTAMLCGLGPACEEPETALAAARANLKSCYLAGTLEKIGPTLDLFSAAYPRWFGPGGHHETPNVERAHDASRPVDVSESARKKFEAEAWADLELWSGLQEALS